MVLIKPLAETAGVGTPNEWSFIILWIIMFDTLTSYLLFTWLRTFLEKAHFSFLLAKHEEDLLFFGLGLMVWSSWLSVIAVLFGPFGTLKHWTAIKQSYFWLGNWTCFPARHIARPGTPESLSWWRHTCSQVAQEARSIGDFARVVHTLAIRAVSLTWAVIIITLLLEYLFVTFFAAAEGFP